MEEFKRRGVRVVGTEASPYRAQHCRERGLEVFDCSLNDFAPIKHLAPFDFVYSTHVLEHITNPATHVKNVSDLIDEDGWLYTQVPHMTRGEFLFQQAHYVGHCQSFSPRSLSLLLKSNGFAPVRVQLDSNIQILARKIAIAHSSLVPRDTADPMQLLEPFEHLLGEQKKPLRVLWFPDLARIVRVQDGQVLYPSCSTVNSRWTETSRVMEFSFQCDQEGVSFPLHFHYPGDTPPTWLKRG